MARPGTIIERRSLRRINLDLSITRYVLYAVAALAMAGAVAKIVRGEPPAVVQRVEAGRAADPAFAGFAAEFVRAYIEYDPNAPETREAALARFVAGDGGDLGRPERRQHVQDVDVVVVAPEGRDGALVTVAAVVAGESRYLAIPVLRRDGDLALAGAPAEVGAPLARPVEDLSLPGEPVDDPPLEEVVTRALTSYLAGDADGLAADLLPGVIVNTPDRRLALRRLDELNVTAPGRLWAAVTITDRSRATHRFVYPLRVEQSGGRWFVAGINQPNP